MTKLSEDTFYGSLNLLQGLLALQGQWQCPLAPDPYEVFKIATPGGLYTPMRVPQGILNETPYFQATPTRVLEGLNCMALVKVVFYWGLDETDLLNTLDPLLESLEGVGPYAAAHK